MKRRANSIDEAWVQNLPYSHLTPPERFGDKLKYVFWRLITPMHPHVRDFLSYAKILRHQGRQNYLLGKLAPNESIEGFVSFLIDKGFGNHFVAFRDDGQVVSMRYAPNFKYQYHLRVFEDGEVRGHYEYTPEYRPFMHMKSVGMEPRLEDFRRLLGDRVVPVQSAHGSFTWSFAGRKRS